jgi:sirohydrochlorin cobaltochelatase
MAELAFKPAFKSAFILLAHGAREAAWSGTPRRVRDRILAQAPGLRVELAFIGQMPPDLGECVDKLAAEGFERIRVMPLFIAQGAHLTRAVPQGLEELRRKHPEVRLDLLPPVGEAESVVQAMAAHVLGLMTEDSPVSGRFAPAIFTDP